MEDRKRQDFPVNCIRLCFEVLDDEQCKGSISGVALKNAISFCGLKEFIIVVDDAFNEIGQPQPHQVLRSFKETSAYQPYNSRPERYNSSEDIASMTGGAGTLDMIMLSRQHAEWQGIIKNIKGERVGAFNSSMECMSLLKSSI